MKRLLLLLCLCAAPPGALAQPAEVAWQPLGAALEAAQGRPALVYVGAPWCGPCRRLERETFADPAVRHWLGAFALARLTIDEHEATQRVGPYRLSEAAWAARLGAETTPTLILLDPQGAVLGRLAGFVPPDALLALLSAPFAPASR